MWIFTTAGFVSAVEHRDNSDLLMVRGRDKESLETMLQGIEAAGKAANEDYGVDAMVIYSEGGSDYPWRVVVSKATFAIWTQHEVLNFLNYHNFKSALTKVKGEKWHNAAMKVWSAMLAVEDVPRKRVNSYFKPVDSLDDDELNALLRQEGIIDAEHDYRNMSEAELEDIHAVLVEMNSDKAAQIPKPRHENDIESAELAYEVSEGRVTYAEAMSRLYPNYGYDGDPEFEVDEDGVVQGYYEPDELSSGFHHTPMYADEGSETIPSEDWHYNEDKDRWNGIG